MKNPVVNAYGVVPAAGQTRLKRLTQTFPHLTQGADAELKLPLTYAYDNLQINTNATKQEMIDYIDMIKIVVNSEDVVKVKMADYIEELEQLGVKIYDGKLPVHFMPFKKQTRTTRGEDKFYMGTMGLDALSVVIVPKVTNDFTLTLGRVDAVVRPNMPFAFAWSLKSRTFNGMGQSDKFSETLTMYQKDGDIMALRFKGRDAIERMTLTYDDVELLDDVSPVEIDILNENQAVENEQKLGADLRVDFMRSGRIDTALAVKDSADLVVDIDTTASAPQTMHWLVSRSWTLNK